MAGKSRQGSSKPANHSPHDQEYDHIVQQGVGIIARFQRFGMDFLGVLLLAFALLTLLALTLPELTGGTLVILWRNFIHQACQQVRIIQVDMHNPSAPGL